jgi:hypothetical protein
MKFEASCSTAYALIAESDTAAAFWLLLITLIPLVGTSSPRE